MRSSGEESFVSTFNENQSSKNTAKLQQNVFDDSPFINANKGSEHNKTTLMEFPHRLSFPETNQHL